MFVIFKRQKTQESVRINDTCIPSALTEPIPEKRTVISSNTSEWHYEAKEAAYDYCYRLNIRISHNIFTITQQYQI